MTGKEIIEKALEDTINSTAFEVGLLGMDIDQCYAYQQGLVAAYQHALEMWDE